MEYNYEIVNVDAAARCMEVRYTSAGRDPVHISMRLPYASEQLEAVIDSFSPVRYWEEQDTAVFVPEVGHAGVKAPPVSREPTVQEQIVALEATITPRRLREAVLTGDHSFINSVEESIAALRSAL